MATRVRRPTLSAGLLIVVVALGVIIALFTIAVAALTSGAEQKRNNRLPNLMMATWSVNVTRNADHYGDEYTATVAISDKVIAVADTIGVRLLDPATGQTRKILPLTSGATTGVWLSGTVLVVRTAETVSSRKTLAGYDYTTGNLLWKIEQPDDYITVPMALVHSGVVVYREGKHEGATTLTGLAADTGRQLWSKKIYATCPSDTIGSGGYENVDLVPAGSDSFVVLQQCGNFWDTVDETVYGIDSTDGSTQWRKKLQMQRKPCVNADDSVVIVDSSDQFTLLNLTGKTLLTRREPGGTSCAAINSIGTNVALARGAAVELIDLQDGDSDWRKSDPSWGFGEHSRLVTLEGRLYSSNQTTSTLLPNFVSATDPSTGDTITLPVLLRGDLVGTTGRFLIYRTYHAGWVSYTAIQPETGRVPNPVLGGTEPDDWPDACSILQSADVTSLGGFGAFSAQKDTKIFGVEIPSPIQCNYLADRSDDAFSLTVAWVGNDRGALASLLEAYADELGGWASEAKKIDDGVFLIRETPHNTSEALLLHGSYALRIAAPGNSRPSSEQLVRKVAKRLLNSTPPPTSKSNTSVTFNIDSAKQVIRTFGYEPESTGTPVGPLRAITAICSASATAYCQQIFFFFGNNFVGVGSGEDPAHGAIYRSINIASQDGQKIIVDYGFYRDGDANCCPSGRRTQTYQYMNSSLEYKTETGAWQAAPKDPLIPR